MERVMVSETLLGEEAGSASGIKIIDADTHLTEPHDLWTSRAPAKWKDKVPQVKMFERILTAPS
jgi:hypothetical protein